MKNFTDILNKFNIIAKNKSLYERAFTHSSYIHEHEECEDYERIEYVGDAVLDLAVADLIYKNHPLLDQGLMSKLRAQIVCGKNLAKYAREYDFGSHIRLGHGEYVSGGENSDKILEDVFEAFIGAYYLDYNYESAYELVKKIMLDDIINFDLESVTDYKSKLQEAVQSDRRGTVTYRVVKEIGNAQNKIFEVEAILYDNYVLGYGRGSSKKKAEQEAARDALQKAEVIDTKKKVQ